MATPPDTQETSLSKDPSGMALKDEVEDLARSRMDSLDDSFDDGTWDFHDDGRPKTRRVNPQRLAIRLGPDLVAEMEALITPGAKMPTFTVRKDFQERYNVDRRHIYDYFHSRGLRVAKEDKHTNLIRGRAMKAQAQAAQLQVTAKPLPSTKKETSVAVKEEASASDISLSWLVAESTASLSKPRGRAVPAKRQSKAQEKKIRTVRRTKAHSSKSAKPATQSDFLVALPFSGEHRGEFESFMATSSYGTEADWDTIPNCPDFSLPCDSSDDNTEKASDMSDFLPSPDEFVAGYFESPTDGRHSFLDIGTSSSCELDLSSLMTVDEHPLLNQEERTELYDLINNNIPRTLSLEESSGTYNNYMDEQSLSYYDYLLPATQINRSWKTGVHHNSSLTAACDPPISTDVPDIRAWLSDDLLYPPAAIAREYDPMRDSSEESMTLDETPLTFVAGEHVLLDSLAFQRSQNQAPSGKALKGSEGLIIK